MDLNLKAINNLSLAGQLAIFLAFAAAIVAAGWYFFVSGYGEQIALKQQQLDGLKLEIQRGQAVEQKHQEFVTQNKQLAEKLATLKTILPEAKQTDELLRQIQEGAMTSNLSIKRFQPLPVVEKEFFSEWPINLEVDGTYHSLGVFFDKLSKLSRIVNVADLKVSGSSKNANYSVAASCTATTFVYNDEKDRGEGNQQAATAKKK